MRRGGYLAAMAAAVAAPAGLAVGITDLRRRKATNLVARHREAIEARDWDTVSALYSPDVTYSDPETELVGIEAVVARARELEQPFADAVFAERSTHVADHFAVMEWTYSGRNTGEITLRDGRHLGPAGRNVALKGMSLYEIRNGKIVSEHSYWDNAALAAELAAEPVPESAS